MEMIVKAVYAVNMLGLTGNLGRIYYMVNRVFACLLTLVLFLGLLSCAEDGDDDGGSEDSREICSVIGVSPKIINGEPCSDQNSPVVKITLISQLNETFLCSGTMLTQTDVLTAGHCFINNVRSAYIDANGRRIPASAVKMHPNFTPQGSAIFNDVAILRLSAAANLPTLPLVVSRTVQGSDSISIFGYGQSVEQTQYELSDPDTLGHLRGGRMTVANATANHITANFNGDGSNTCFGDSGGPALYTLDGPQGRLTGVVGITSTGIAADCGSGDVSMFTNIQGNSVFSFIRQAVPGAGLI